MINPTYIIDRVGELHRIPNPEPMPQLVLQWLNPGPYGPGVYILGSAAAGPFASNEEAKDYIRYAEYRSEAERASA